MRDAAERAPTGQIAEWRAATRPRRFAAKRLGRSPYFGAGRAVTLFIGLMSGTSMDAVDAVVADIDATRVRVIAHHSEPMPADLRAELLPLSQGATTLSLEGLGRMHIRVGRTFANAALASMAKALVPSSRIVAIGSHGQTLLHSPQGPNPFFQIGDPDVIAEETGITTVANFRGADIAAGGQGAPLTPAFHEVQFRQDGVDRVVLNLGGIANITVLPGEPDAPVRGFDTGPGNALMDEWALLHLGSPMDRDGLWAAAGTPVPTLLTALKSDPYFGQGPRRAPGGITSMARGSRGYLRAPCRLIVTRMFRRRFCASPRTPSPRGSTAMHPPPARS